MEANALLWNGASLPLVMPTRYNADQPLCTELLKNMALHLPRRERERKLTDKLGKIESCSVLSYNQGLFQIKITTNSAIYRIETSVLSSIEDIKQYDVFAKTWFPHCKRLTAFQVLKSSIDSADILAARLAEDLRTLSLNQSPEGQNIQEEEEEEDVAGMDMLK